MGNSKITVLVPVYNVEKYITKCLDSLMAQSFKDFEVWAVSDGSPDNSAKIINEYSKKDPRIKLIEKENGGYGSVLQYGVDNVRSKYLLVCDPDDWLAEDALSDLYTFAEDNRLDIAVADRFNVYSSDPTDIDYVYTFKGNPKIKPKVVYDQSNGIQSFSNGLSSPHAKLFRSTILKGITFPLHVNFTDFVLYIMSLANSNRVAYLNEALAYYLTDRPGNTRTDVDPKVIGDYLVGWNSILEQLEVKGVAKNRLLLSKLLRQIKFILSQYAKVSQNRFKDDYWTNLLLAIKKLQSYNLKLPDLDDQTVKGKIIDMGLMNSKFYTVFAKIKVIQNS